ncbi:MAG: hypothetical protein JWM10_844 [Myxococcaceae bacterium]|nr:hypothetical protein [Myxococcaceae bacterium]
MLSDWLIQDVCARPDGTLLADDPWDGCPSGSVRRDLAVGDALPYHRHDQPAPGAPQGYQRHDSFPRSGAGLRQLSTFDFAPFGEFNPAQDGYDALELDGAYASIIGTRDPVGLAQTFFGSCRLDDAWILLPTANFFAGGSTVAHLRLVAWERAGQAFPGTCPSGNDASFTRWALRPVDFGGVGGAPTKRIDALVVDHHGGDNPVTADHIERFYFTTAYGLTRWERWQNNAGTPRPEGCAGATQETTFRRVDCRDWTNIVPDATPFPPGAWPSPYVDGNLVRNHDFGGATFANWDRLGASTTGAQTNVSIVEEGGDHHLATNCAGACTAGQAVFQDVARGGVGGTIRFGYRVRVDAARAPIELVVFERDAGGAIVARHAVSVDAGRAWARVTAPSFEVQPATTQFRITVYLSAPDTFRVDDFWLAREPGRQRG